MNKEEIIEIVKEYIKENLRVNVNVVACKDADTVTDVYIDTTVYLGDELIQEAENDTRY